MKLFRIFDSKAKAFLPSWSSETAGTAIRAFEAAANDEGSNFNKYAGDYTLFEVGSEDDQSGVLVPIENGFVNLGTALQLLQLNSFPRETTAARGLGPQAVLGSNGTREIIAPTNKELD